jgi:hypothetical protein
LSTYHNNSQILSYILCHFNKNDLYNFLFAINAFKPKNHYWYLVGEKFLSTQHRYTRFLCTRITRAHTFLLTLTHTHTVEWHENVSVLPFTQFFVSLFVKLYCLKGFQVPKFWSLPFHLCQSFKQLKQLCIYQFHTKNGCNLSFTLPNAPTPIISKWNIILGFSHSPLDPIEIWICVNCLDIEQHLSARQLTIDDTFVIIMCARIGSVQIVCLHFLVQSVWIFFTLSSKFAHLVEHVMTRHAWLHALY